MTHRIVCCMFIEILQVNWFPPLQQKYLTAAPSVYTDCNVPARVVKSRNVVRGVASHATENATPGSFHWPSKEWQIQHEPFSLPRHPLLIKMRLNWQWVIHGPFLTYMSGLVIKRACAQVTGRRHNQIIVWYGEKKFRRKVDIGLLLVSIPGIWTLKLNDLLPNLQVNTSERAWRGQHATGGRGVIAAFFFFFPVHEGPVIQVNHIRKYVTTTSTG